MTRDDNINRRKKKKAGKQSGDENKHENEERNRGQEKEEKTIENETAHQSNSSDLTSENENKGQTVKINTVKEAEEEKNKAEDTICSVNLTVGNQETENLIQMVGTSVEERQLNQILNTEKSLDDNKEKVGTDIGAKGDQNQPKPEGIETDTNENIQDDVEIREDECDIQGTEVSESIQTQMEAIVNQTQTLSLGCKIDSKEKDEMEKPGHVNATIKEDNKTQGIKYNIASTEDNESGPLEDGIQPAKEDMINPTISSSPEYEKEQEETKAATGANKDSDVIETIKSEDNISPKYHGDLNACAQVVAIEQDHANPGSKIIQNDLPDNKETIETLEVSVKPDPKQQMNLEVSNVKAETVGTDENNLKFHDKLEPQGDIEKSEINKISNDTRLEEKPDTETLNTEDDVVDNSRNVGPDVEIKDELRIQTKKEEADHEETTKNIQGHMRKRSSDIQTTDTSGNILATVSTDEDQKKSTTTVQNSLVEIFGTVLPHQDGKVNSHQNSLRDHVLEHLKDFFKPLIMEALQNSLPSITQNTNGIKDKELEPLAEDSNNIKKSNDELNKGPNENEKEPNDQIEAEKPKLETSLATEEVQSNLIKDEDADDKGSNEFKVIIREKDQTKDVAGDDKADTNLTLQNNVIPNDQMESNDIKPGELAVFAVVSTDKDSTDILNSLDSNEVDKEQDLETELNEQHIQALTEPIDHEATINVNLESQFDLDYVTMPEFFGTVLPMQIKRDKYLQNSSNDQSIEYLRAIFKPLIMEALQNIIPAYRLEQEPLQPVIDESSKMREPNDRILNDKESNCKLQHENEVNVEVRMVGQINGNSQSAKEPNDQPENEKNPQDQLENTPDPIHQLWNEIELTDKLLHDEQEPNDQLWDEKEPKDPLQNEKEPNDQLQMEQNSNDQLQNEKESNDQLQNEKESNDQLQNEKDSNDQLQNEKESNDQLEPEEINTKKLVKELEDDDILYTEVLQILTQSVVPKLAKILQKKFSHFGCNSEALKSVTETSTVEDLQTPSDGIDVHSLLNPSIEVKAIDTPNFESTRIEDPDEEVGEKEERLSVDLSENLKEMVVKQKNADQESSEVELKEDEETNEQIVEANDSIVKTNVPSDLDRTFDTTNGVEIKPSQEPLRFHPVHGDNIHLSKNNFRIQRQKKSNFFSKGIAFSSRPVSIGEKVSLRLKQLSSYWLGLITIGFTTNDPMSIADDLPTNVIIERDCADGFWAEHLDKKYYQESCRLHYYLNSSGNMCFGVNGVDKIEFLWNLETTKPVWALIDIFGYFTVVEFDIPKEIRNTSFIESSLLSDRNDSGDSFNHSLDTNEINKPSLNYQIRFVPLDLFTYFEGSCMKFLEDRGVCVTSYDKGGCIDGKLPLFPGQIIVVQNLSVGKALFHIGVKYCSPITEASPNLPEPVQTNVIMHVKDELAITFTETGEIRVTKNLDVPKTILKVNRSQELWPFVKIFKRNQMIKLWSSNTPSLAAF